MITVLAKCISGNNVRASWVLSLIVIALVGCQKQRVATIRGEVTLNGELVDGGVISFIPEDGPPVTSEIRNGRYEAKTTAGKLMVQVSAPIVVDRRRESSDPDSPWVDITRERLPDNYNSKTDITFEAQPGANTKNWLIEVQVNKN